MKLAKRDRDCHLGSDDKISTESRWPLQSVICDWQTSITQAHASDWITAASYLLAAFLSARAARLAGLSDEFRENLFWRLVAVLLLLLGFNEMLDLQTLLTSGGREYAKAQGWYGERRTMQFVFVLSLGVAAVMTGVAMLHFTRRAHAAVRMALVGLALIAFFIFLRAASFNHLDEVFGAPLPSLSWASLQEAAGIVIIAAAAALYARYRRRRQ